MSIKKNLKMLNSYIIHKTVMALVYKDLCTQAFEIRKGSVDCLGLSAFALNCMHALTASLKISVFFDCAVWMIIPGLLYPVFLWTQPVLLRSIPPISKVIQFGIYS